jgi:copper resistance protein C
MQRHFYSILLAAYVGISAPGAACAHAFLDHAVPAVGSTVSSAPRELLITYTENVVVAFSGVSLRAEGGGAVPVSRPTLGPPNTLHVRIGRALKGGTYTVSWHVVSVATPHPQGTYKFTVAP